MTNVIDVLLERGFIEQTTHDDKLRRYADSEQITCYIGFDPTASSLHIGSLVPIMSLAHMQRLGHRPIALVGGGTGLVGDPSGKTEMRQLLTAELVEKNAQGLKKQLSNFIDFSDNKALMLNNADWLTKLEYIPFLRDVGRHFSVNRMIKAESYKVRLESDEGLNFIEFNYMLLQAYDFLELYSSHNCRLQMGGSDQWGNIVAGVELIRRMRQETAFGVTFPLITTSGGAKMGKTASGAIWLAEDRTSPYEYYQYWINTDDRDVERFMALFTFLPMEEIRDIKKLDGSDLNTAKIVLAFETTLLAHGKAMAEKAYQKSASHFGTRSISRDILPSSRIHTEFQKDLKISVKDDVTVDDVVTIDTVDSTVDEKKLKAGIPVFKLFHTVGLVPSSSAARRLIQQGGAYINDQRVKDFDQVINDDYLDENKTIVLRAGKKRFHKIKIKK
ncbi:MAG: tyrosine--tRNA ligase [Deltaproteobacteria bacterium]|nr:tyrosine--tRNA ligase [Deltaproteobacteria bacterium]